MGWQGDNSINKVSNKSLDKNESNETISASLIKRQQKKVDTSSSNSYLENSTSKGTISSKLTGMFTNLINSPEISKIISYKR